MTLLTICAASGVWLSVSAAMALDGDRIPMLHNPYAVFVHHEQIREESVKEIQKIKAEMNAIPGTNNMEIAHLKSLRCQLEKLSLLLLDVDVKHQELEREKQGGLGNTDPIHQELNDLKRRVRDLERELRLMKIGC